MRCQIEAKKAKTVSPTLSRWDEIVQYFGVFPLFSRFSNPGKPEKRDKMPKYYAHFEVHDMRQKKSKKAVLPKSLYGFVYVSGILILRENLII